MTKTSSRAMDFPVRPAQQAEAKDCSPPPFIPASASGLPLGATPGFLAAIEGGAVIVSAAVAKATYLDHLVGTLVPLGTYLLIAACMAATLCAFFLQMGLYEVDSLTAPQVGVGKLIGGAVVSLLTVLGLLYAVKEIGDLSRGWVFVWLGLTILSIIVIRLLFARWVKRGMSTGRIIWRTAVIGSTDFALSVGAEVRASEGLSCAVDLYHCSASARDLRFVGGLDQLAEALAIHPYDRVVVAIPSADSETIRSVVKKLGAFTTELLVCDDLRRMPILTRGARQFGRIHTDVVHFMPQSEHAALLKRTTDIVVASLGLLLLAPLFLLAALAIKLDSSGPVFFRQRRLGQNGIAFRIFKFRSMFVEEDGPVVTAAILNDDRVTRFGRVLRWTSLDETPQLINVLWGDMSLVGPRPHAVAHDTEFEKNSDLFTRRRRVKPGITGWAQVNGFRGEMKTADDVRRRMEHDLYFIENWSFWLDLEIMVRTVLVLTRGAY